MGANSDRRGTTRASRGVGPISAFIEKHFRHFNSRETREAAETYKRHVKARGKMMVALGGAMSSGELGVSLAHMIRARKVHAISTTGANLEESLFRLVANDHYQSFPRYARMSIADNVQILNAGHRRVTDMSIPEEEAFRAVESIILPMWINATKDGTRRFWHEYFYELILALTPDQYQGNPDECWLLAAARANLPIVVPGYEDSTFGNIFAGYVKRGECNASIAKSGIEYMVDWSDKYQALSKGAGLGFFQIGGGISGDFPICVVPHIRYDLEQEVKPWAYFCQIGDSHVSNGGYSGATPDEKITWDKLTAETPMFDIKGDASVIAPLIFAYVLDM